MKTSDKYYKITLLLLLLALFSCKKEAAKPSDTGNSGTLNPKLLTAKTWEYYEYFENYSQPTASLVYKLERANNTLDLSKIQVSFKADSTYEETKDSKSIRLGRWKVKSAAEIEVTDTTGVLIFTIITVNEGFWVFTNTKQDIYGTMLAQ